MSSTGNEGVALVTGAAGDVGAAVVARLQQGGYRVAGLDLEPCSADLPLIVDVTDREATKAAAHRASTELGPISVLVTTAVAHDAAPIGTMSRERWQRLLAAHLGGTTNAIAAVVPGMVAGHRGTVVTTSSWLALAGQAGEAHNAAATGTVLAFTKSFALEVAADGVRVNCIAVGPATSAEPLSGGMADDVADTVMFLVREGEFYVGQVFEPFSAAVV